ncbi:MAG: tryptophan synthase subunit alpha [Saprospiraceae bacterium]|nr:tryptophan synthase subunit alpha [Saprospiraceae bacterium]
MSRIRELFDRKNRYLLNIYFTAGYPSLHDTVPIIQSLTDAGVDLIEIGMPYSDPMADGPTIQHSSSVAIKQGMTVDLLFDQVREARKLVDTPLLLMGYLNQMMQYGVERFVTDAVAAGVDGLIIPDLPLDIYMDEYKNLISDAGLDMVFLITPQTNAERIRYIDSLSTGFIYMVSDASITGATSAISEAQLAYFNRVKNMDLVNPRLIGFGISDAESFSTACQYAQGAIIGSAFIKVLEKSKENLCEGITSFIHSLRNPTTSP